MANNEIAMTPDIAKHLAPYRLYPVEFARDVLGITTLDNWQQDVLRHLVTHQKIAVAGCTGSGKDFDAAIAIVWFMATNWYPKVICTAVKEDTLKDNLWAEISKVVHDAPIMHQLFSFQAQKISMKGAEERWFAVARTSSKRYSKGGGNAQSEGLAGKYADDTLTVIDEASGVDNSTFDALEGSANTLRRKMLVIANPLRRSGRFAEIFLNPKVRQYWWTVNVTYKMSSRLMADPEEVKLREQWLEMYGENSAFYQARALGNFPMDSTDDTVFPRSDIDKAMTRYAKAIEKKPDAIEDDKELPIQIGVDCARFGADETVYIVRRGNKFLEMKCQAQTTVPDIVETVIHLAHKYSNREEPKENAFLVVDETGVGAGVVDALAKDGWNIAGVNNSSRATDPDSYFNLGCELWFDMKETIKECEIENDSILADQLEKRTFRFTGKAKQRALQTKDDMRKSGLGSPDRADALVLAFADITKVNIGPAKLAGTIAFF